MSKAAKQAPHEKRRPGRPVERPYTAEIAATICALVSEGQTIRQICARDDMPSTRLLWQWLDAHQEFAAQYARARESAADLFEADIVAAAYAVDPENAAAARVQIDALKWVAARRAPKKYGDKIQTEHSGGVAWTLSTGVPSA